MSQFTAVLTNHDLFVDHLEKKLVAMTEIIILAIKPKYIAGEESIIKSNSVEELRFKCTPEGLDALIEKLSAAKKNAEHYEKFAVNMNDSISPAPEGRIVGEREEGGEG